MFYFVWMQTIHIVLAVTSSEQVMSVHYNPISPNISSLVWCWSPVRGGADLYTDHRYLSPINKIAPATIFWYLFWDFSYFQIKMKCYLNLRYSPCAVWYFCLKSTFVSHKSVMTTATSPPLSPLKYWNIILIQSSEYNKASHGFHHRKTVQENCWRTQMERLLW